MSLLVDGLPKEDRYGNPIYYDFRNMLAIEQAMYNPEFDQREKWIQAIVLLYGDMEASITPVDDLAGEVAWFYSGGAEAAHRSSGTAQKLYDFSEDADYFVGDFQRFYNLDLLNNDIDLHWWRFLALFRALPDNSHMGQRIYYRGVDTSKMKGEERKRHVRLKNAFALKAKPRDIHRPSLRERILLAQKLESEQVK